MPALRFDTHEKKGRQDAVAPRKLRRMTANTTGTLSLSASERAWSLAGVYACIFANGVGMGLSLPLLSLILERAGVSGTVNGLNAAFGSLAMVAVTPFVPALAARFGAVRFLAASYVVTALSLIAFRASDSILLWFILRFTLNSGLQSLFVVSEVWINQVSAEETRGRAVAVYASLLSGGFALGTLIVQIVGTRGWLPFLIGAAVILAALVPLLLARRFVPPVEYAPPAAMGGFVFKSPSASFAALTFGALDICLGSFLPVYMVRLGSPEADAVQLLGAWALGNMILQPLIGWISDKTDRRLVLIACGVVGVLGAIAMPFLAHQQWLALTLVFVWGGVVLGLYTIGLAHLGSRFRGAELAAANAAFAFLYGVGALAGPGIGGGSIDLWNPHGLMVALGGISAAYVGVAAWRYLRS